MTLNQLIEKATAMSRQLSSGDLPLLFCGRTFDFDIEFTPVKGKNSEYVNHVRMDIKM